MPVKPIPATPPGHSVSYIRNPRFENTAKTRLVIIGGEERHWIPVKVKPPRFHCVPGKNLNWSVARGFHITRVQAKSLCGVQPDPTDPRFINNGWEPKHWRPAPMGTVVSCPRCLALMRAALRPKLRLRPQPKFREHIYAADLFDRYGRLMKVRDRNTDGVLFRDPLDSE